ncbi:MAG: hypothetical protein QXP01_00340 [Candidatus Hadarchaeum sp.]
MTIVDKYYNNARMASKHAVLRCQQASFAKVDSEGRAIYGVSAITRGEASGHGLWIDDVALDQFARLVNANSNGIRVRYGHPTPCEPDGLRKQLGRAIGAYRDGNKVRLDEIRFYKRVGGARAEMIADILALAVEDPDGFGMSFSFYRDLDQEEEFIKEHTEDGVFVSPDPDNVNGLPHVRVASVEAIDFVDIPAANRSLFAFGDRFSILKDFDEDAIGDLVCFMLSVSPYVSGAKKVDLVARRLFREIGVDVDDLRAFLSRIIEKRGLAVVSKDSLFGDAKVVERFGAISYDSAHSGGTKLAPKDTPWDGPREVAAADDVDDLYQMCAWYDESRPDVKSSYKLPHHRAADKAAVWRGVANAAARLPATKMPDEDRPGVRRHLAKHYREFDEEPPWGDEQMRHEKMLAMDSRWSAYESDVAEYVERCGDISDAVLAELLIKHGYNKEAFAVAPDVAKNILVESIHKKIILNAKDLIDKRIKSFVMKVTGKII